ncbi:MAG TPA: response regulator transcription factor [Verrucomicrobiae bacterium]|nr:response regulator transcription factor [Verrucomicrobiae bacterium]
MNKGKILIVDDEPQIRRVMRSALSKQGYTVADARTGEEALGKIRVERFDLIILDHNMPGMGGLATCREIRSSSDVGIIMLTVRKAESDKIDGLDAGADDYLTKPFSMPELLAHIRANLRRTPLSPQEGPVVVSFDGIEVNFGTHHVSVHGEDVRLTPKEFEVLHYLIANPNVAIPHSKILQAVWGPDYGDEVGYLHVFINQIRKKIEPDPAKPRYIITEPWLGYRFQLPEKS